MSRPTIPRRRASAAAGLCPAAFVLLLLALAAPEGARAQTTITVDDDGVECPSPDFNTINAAVAAAAPGDIIAVCAGTYAELVSINKSLQLRGAQFGVDARDAGRTGLPATESVVAGLDLGGGLRSTGFNVTASDVTIDGFTQQGATSATQLGFGILIGAGTSGTQVLNNIVQNNIAGLSLANNHAVVQTVIRRNLFRNNNAAGPVSGSAIYSDEFNAGGALTNALIDDNTFSGNTGADALSGTAVNLSSTTPGSQTAITISNNIFTGNGRAFLAFNLQSSSFTGNEVSGSVFTGSADLRLFEGNSNLTITNNLLTGGATADFRAVRLTDAGTGAGPSSGIKFNCNGISGYTGAGVENDAGTAYAGTLDARFVWWNSPTGPTDPENPGGTGEEIVDPDNEVVYQPFLAAGDAAPSVRGFQCPNTAVAGAVLISEFRLRGPAPNGAQNEFVELYNASGADIIVSDPDLAGGGGGWALVSSEDPAVPKFVVPEGTIIPARGHFLAVNPNGYSLSNYPSVCPCTPTIGDIIYTDGIPNGSGLALFRTALPANFTAANRLDAVGFAVSGVGFSEGAPLTPAGGITVNVEHSFVRRLTSGVPRDTQDNESDFAFVATDGAVHDGRQSELGAPGPQNLSSPRQLNDRVKASLLDPAVSSFSVPNFERDSSVVSNGQHGTLFIRRRFTNMTGQAITRLRFRVVDITTLNSPGYAPGNSQSDLRVLGSNTDTVGTTSGPVSVSGLTREQPPNQGALGGGYNTSLSDDTITLASPLAPGASVNVAFRMGVEQRGSFRFFVNVEALTEDGGGPVATVKSPPASRGGKKATANKAGKGRR